MQIKFIISNHSIRETTLCAAQTYGPASGGYSWVSVASRWGSGGPSTPSLWGWKIEVGIFNMEGYAFLGSSAAGHPGPREAEPMMASATLPITVAVCVTVQRTGHPRPVEV